MGTLVKRGKKYTAIFRKMVGGITKVKSISLGTDKRSIAQKLFSKLQVDFQEGKIDLFNDFSFDQWLRSSDANATGSKKLEDCIQKFLVDAHHLREVTLRNYRHILSLMASHIAETMPIKLITSNDIISFLESGDRNNNSYNTYLTHIKVFFNWALKNELIVDNPITGLRKKPVDDNLSQQILTEEDLQLILNEHAKYIDEEKNKGTIAQEWQHQRWFRPLIMTYFYAGLRRSEALRLKWRDIDFNERFLHVRSAKGGKSVTIVILTPLLNELKSWKKKSNGDLVFPSAKKGAPKDTQITGGTVQKVFKMILRRTNLDESIHIHSLRHSCVTYLLMKGVDILLVNKTLRHSSLDITRRYEHLVPSHLRDRLDALKL